MDAGFDFTFKGSCEAYVLGKGRTVAFGAYLERRHRVRKGYLLSHYLSSHDEPMAIYNLGGDKDAPASVRGAADDHARHPDDLLRRGGRAGRLRLADEPQRHAVGRARSAARRGRARATSRCATATSA